MGWLGKFSIKYKILLIAFVGVISFLGYLGFNYAINSENSRRLAQVRDVAYPYLESANANIVRVWRLEEMLVSAVTTGERDSLQASKQLSQEILESFDLQRELRPEKRNDIDQIQRVFTDYYNLTYELSLTMLDSEGFVGLQEKFAQKTELLEDVQTRVQSFRDQAYEYFSGLIKAADNSSQQVINVGLLIAAVTIIILIVTSITIAGFITRNINSVASSLKAISEGDGDLTQRIEKNTDDELGELVVYFNKFVDKLQIAISEVINVIEPMSRVSSELSDVTHTTQQLSADQRQVSEKVSRVMSDMLNNVEEVARHASSAADAAKEADDDAKRGRVVVTESVTLINDLAGEVREASTVIQQLQQDTENVGTILDVIKSVAEQTNLLALNAAIEAARAGEQGRGFAVVADEVRTLASRTQQSTSEIHNVIEKLQSAAHSATEVMARGQQRADMSVTQAGETGSSLEAITTKVESISQMNKQIAEAMVEQQRASEMIQTNVAEMRTAASEAAQGSERTSSVAESLTHLAHKLEGIANQFKV